MAQVIDGTKLFLDEDTRLSLEFNETVTKLIDDKLETLESISDRFKSSTSDGERDALAILMRAELMTLDILQKFQEKSANDLDGII